MSTKRRQHTSKTATEFVAELAKDPVYQARRAEQERVLRQRAEEDRLAEAPLVDDLRTVGMRVESVWDLVNRAAPYPEAVPILLEHLQRPYPPRVREAIARALAVPEANPGWSTLRKLFEEEQDPTTYGVKWALACALGAAANEEVIPDLAVLAMDSRHGLNRLAFVKALVRARNPVAAKVLGEFKRDPTFMREIRRVKGLHR